MYNIAIEIYVKVLSYSSTFLSHMLYYINF